MIYFKLALAIMDLISRFLARADQAHWMNEGERKLMAQQLKEANDAMAKAAGIEAELQALAEPALAKRIEAEGWYRD